MFRKELTMGVRDQQDPDEGKRAIPLNNYLNGNVLYDTLYAKADRVSKNISRGSVAKWSKALLVRENKLKTKWSQV